VLALQYGLLAAAIGVATGGLVWGILALVWPFAKPSEQEIECVAGGIRLYGRLILAQQILGVSCSASSGGYELAIQEQRRRPPTLIRFRSREDLEAAQASLAVGYLGRGYISFPGVADPFESDQQLVLAAFLVPFVGLVLMSLSLSDVYGGGAAVEVAVLFNSLVGSLIALLGFRRSRPLFGLSQAGVHLDNADPGALLGLDPRRNELGVLLPYQSIQTIEANSASLALSAVRKRYLCFSNSRWFGACSEDHLRSFAWQLNDAVRRTRGEGEEHMLPDAVERLRRGNRPLAEWLGEVEALNLSGGGYRGQDLSRDELWRVAEDVDAPMDARGGAQARPRRPRSGASEGGGCCSAHRDGSGQDTLVADGAGRARARRTRTRP
jgi:hypothetical protein